MAPPPVIRLHPDDGVVIARATLLAWRSGRRRRRRGRAHSRRPQGCRPPDRARRAGAALWADHRVRRVADLAGAARARAQLRDGGLRQGLCLWRGCAADRAGELPRQLHGHPPARTGGWRRATTSAS